MFIDKRNTQRISLSHPIQIQFGSQIILKGQLRDVSLKSGFINIRYSVHISINDTLTFLIDNLPNNIPGTIKGTARVSRVDIGEGIAIYFVKMDQDSISRLSKLIGVLS